MREDLPIFTLWYGVVSTLLDRVARFPRGIRPVLGNRILERALDIERHVIRIRFSRRREALFAEANLDLDELRVLVRLAFERRLISRGQYAELAEAMETCGAMLGGWKRSEEAKPA
jgi:hypothetical protein